MPQRASGHALPSATSAQGHLATAAVAPAPSRERGGQGDQPTDYLGQVRAERWPASHETGQDDDAPGGRGHQLRRTAAQRIPESAEY